MMAEQKPTDDTVTTIEEDGLSLTFEHTDSQNTTARCIFAFFYMIIIVVVMFRLYHGTHIFS